MQKYNSTRSISRTFLAASLVLLVLSFALLPAPASAALGIPKQLVPCGQAGHPCQVCDLYTLASNLMAFMLFALATPLLVVALLAAGFFWLTAAGSEQKIERGKSILFSAVIGFLIAFGAWIIINTILDTLAFKNPFNGSAWSDTNFCSQSPFKADTGVGGGSGTGTGTGQPPGGDTTTQPPPGGTLSDVDARAQLTAAGITENAQCPQTCFNGISQAAVDEMISLKQQCPSCMVQISGGSETGHSETGTCTHTSGCKFDISGNNTTLNNYITSNYTQRTPTFGTAQYVANDGYIYTREANGSWDVGKGY